MAVRRVLEQVLRQPGVRQAQPKFSQRAVLNGRLDLTRAEAVSELVAARSRQAAELKWPASMAGSGPDHGAAGTVAGPAHRVGGAGGFRGGSAAPGWRGPAAAASRAPGASAAVRDGRQGDALRQGLRVALVGRPNVGKSSLLNRLSRRERAIVTDLGTTQDLLSEIVLEGADLLFDTAGIRSTDDAVEQLGIARSEEALATADVVLLVLDGHAGWTAEDATLGAHPGADPQDPGRQQGGSACGAFPHPVDVQLSALEGTGRPTWCRPCWALRGCWNRRHVGGAEPTQRDLAARAADALARSQEVAAQQLTLELLDH